MIELLKKIKLKWTLFSALFVLVWFVECAHTLDASKIEYMKAGKDYFADYPITLLNATYKSLFYPFIIFIPIFSIVYITSLKRINWFIGRFFQTFLLNQEDIISVFLMPKDKVIELYYDMSVKELNEELHKEVQKMINPNYKFAVYKVIVYSRAYKIWIRWQQTVCFRLEESLSDNYYLLDIIRPFVNTNTYQVRFIKVVKNRILNFDVDEQKILSDIQIYINYFNDHMRVKYNPKDRETPNAPKVFS